MLGIWAQMDDEFGVIEILLTSRLVRRVVAVVDIALPLA